MPDETPVRGHRRFAVALPLWVRFRKEIQGRVGTKRKSARTSVELEEEEQTTTANIGSGGCFFYTSKKPAVGAPATLLVDVPTGSSRTGNGKVLCRGKVVRVTEEPGRGRVGVACQIDSYTFKPPETA